MVIMFAAGVVAGFLIAVMLIWGLSHLSEAGCGVVLLCLVFLFFWLVIVVFWWLLGS